MKVKEQNEKVGLKLNIQKTKIMASIPITSWQIDGEIMETVRGFILGGSKITADGDCSHEIKRRLLFGRKVMINLDSILKSRDINFANQSPSSQSYGFSSSHIWMWELDYKKSWAQKNWCFWTVVLEKTLESPMDWLQHTRFPCPSPTLGACSNSCQLSQWCHPVISSSVIPFSSCLQSFQHQSLFLSHFFPSGGQIIGASALVLPMNNQGWFPLGLTGWISWESKGRLRVFSNTTVQKHQFFGAQPSSQSNSHIHTWPQEKP